MQDLIGGNFGITGDFDAAKAEVKGYGVVVNFLDRLALFIASGYD